MFGNSETRKFGPKSTFPRPIISALRSAENREIQTTFVLRCGKVGMWEWNSRKATRREHTFFCVIQNVDFSDQLDRYITISELTYIT